MVARPTADSRFRSAAQHGPRPPLAAHFQHRSQSSQPSPAPEGRCSGLSRRRRGSPSRPRALRVGQRYWHIPPPHPHLLTPPSTRTPTSPFSLTSLRPRLSGGPLRGPHSRPPRPLRSPEPAGHRRPQAPARPAGPSSERRARCAGRWAERRRGGAPGTFWAADADPGSQAGNAAAAGLLGPRRGRAARADMAKWGQGDPRWIVEEREDGTNVNNWHWTERDATSWSKRKLRESLVGIVVENETGRCQISDLKQVEGEASCSSRKGKLIFFYEWNIKLGWKGIIKESGAKHKGLIEIPNLSEENEVDDTEVNVSKKKGDGDGLKDLMKTAGTAKVREALGDYLKALKTEFTMGMILPTKATAIQELTIKRKLSENTLQVPLGVRIPTVALHMMELFDAGVERLYSIFTVKELVQKFSKSPAILEAEKGGKFQMFDGNVTGEYIELLTNEKIVMKWRCRSWPEEHYATVVLNFVPTPGQTELQLDCKGVPVCKEENMKFCWQKQHFEEIKSLLQLTTLNG